MSKYLERKQFQVMGLRGWNIATREGRVALANCVGYPLQVMPFFYVVDKDGNELRHLDHLQYYIILPGLFKTREFVWKQRSVKAQQPETIRNILQRLDVPQDILALFDLNDYEILDAMEGDSVDELRPGTTYYIRRKK